MYEIENVEGYGEDMDGLAEPLSILMPPTGRGEFLWPIIRRAGRL